MAHGRALRVVAALGPGQCSHLGVEDGAEHLQARTHGEGEQALLELTGEFAHGDTHRVGQRDCPLVRTAQWVGLGLLGRHPPGGPGAAGCSLVVLHLGGPLLDRMSWRRPTPTTRQASGGGPPPQTSTLTGTTSSRHSGSVSEDHCRDILSSLRHHGLGHVTVRVKRDVYRTRSRVAGGSRPRLRGLHGARTSCVACWSVSSGRA